MQQFGACWESTFKTSEVWHPSAAPTWPMGNSHIPPSHTDRIHLTAVAYSPGPLPWEQAPASVPTCEALTFLGNVPQE